MAATTTTTANDVLLYVPNLIGYFRVFCTLVSLLLMMAYPHLWLVATLLYIASFVGDLFGKYRIHTCNDILGTSLSMMQSFGGCSCFCPQPIAEIKMQLTQNGHCKHSPHCRWTCGTKVESNQYIWRLIRYGDRSMFHSRTIVCSRWRLLK